MSEDSNWERKALERVALAAIEEQRRSRRWSVLFRSLGFAYLTFFLLTLVDWGGLGGDSGDDMHTALVNLEGVINAEGDANAGDIVAALQAAFEEEQAAGVILRINSPGGSPVQSGIINDEIRRLRGKYPDKPLYAVVEDICASGGYYVAVAAERIYVDKASIVGSIGVLMDGFGFIGSMDKLGVERRLLTAGKNKAFLDPFSPLNEAHRDHAKSMLGEIHRQFIEVVREGRGDRLKETPEMFSGLMWTGEASVANGLTDAIGSLDSVARDVIKAEEIRDYTVKPNFAERFASRFGVEVASAFTAALASFNLR